MDKLTMTGWTEAVAPNFTGPLLDEGRDVIAVGDVHGRGAVLAALVARLSDQERPQKRTLVFTGDLIDRGDENVMATEVAMAAGDQLGADETVFLAGNHELMMLDAVRDPQYWAPWFTNGGSTVLDEATERLGVEVTKADMIPEVVRTMFPAGWLAAVEAAPTHAIIGRVLFVHGGVDPHDMEGCLAFRADEHRTEDGQNRRHPSWMRKPFLDHEGGWGGMVVVHGHTPAFDRRKRRADAGDIHEKMNVMRFGRINIDAGASTHRRVGFCQMKGNLFRIGVMELA